MQAPAGMHHDAMVKRLGLALFAIALLVPSPTRAASYDDDINAKVSISLDGNKVIDSADTTVTNAQLLALNATPISVLAAPGAGFANVFHGAMVFYDHTTTACGGVAAGEDLVFKYTDGSGEQVSPHVETTGFIDQSADEMRWVGALGADAAVSDVEPVANAAIVIQLLVGEVITCSGQALKVRVFYQVIPSTL